MGISMGPPTKTIVIKYGGSLLFQKDSAFDIKRVKSLATEIINLQKKGQQIVLVVGGGREARKYIHAALELGANQTFCDLLGIKVAQLNAHTLLALFPKSIVVPIIPETIEDATNLVKMNAGKILILGGITPGQSTDAVAAVMAEILEADLLIRATDLDGVYTANPDHDPKATLLPEVSMKQLLQLIGKGRQSAGEYPLLDQVAANILHRSQIPTIFINGKKTQLITQAALTKKVDVGTLITYTKK
jgi:uridylate kinase